ncbi:hypothetical protein CYMTET_10751 [Cymbomonas tetramitiformis]|uniref:Uncharacterized protein n=1 Tax=Cymbomonas tetramitiformis TaxID=36881 RepID=A0AAE0GP56_9CHLO|nr:hypothetical protein CYMTET_10751 [Cymbomonas tetramitiformis]
MAEWLQRELARQRMWTRDNQITCEFCDTSFDLQVTCSQPNTEVNLNGGPASGPSPGGNEMSAAFLRNICKETGMPSFELATTQLQLNGHRFLRIDESIKIYSEVQTLWLERNKISTIENLERFHKLTCLFLQSNFLQQIEGLEALKNLEVRAPLCLG